MATPQPGATFGHFETVSWRAVKARMGGLIQWEKCFFVSVVANEITIAVVALVGVFTDTNHQSSAWTGITTLQFLLFGLAGFVFSFTSVVTENVLDLIVVNVVLMCVPPLATHSPSFTCSSARV